MKTRKEIIDETAAFYTLKNRGVTLAGNCQYLTNEGRTCAVGRCCDNPQPTWVGEAGGIRERDKDEFIGIENLLKPEYRGHPIAFWRQLQGFHDNPDNWTEEGLSEQGQARVDWLHSEFDEK